MLFLEKKGYKDAYYDVGWKDKEYLISFCESDPKVVVSRKDNGWNDDVFIDFRDADYNYDFMLILCEFYGAGHGQRWNIYLFNERNIAEICKLQSRFSEDEIIHGYVETPEWEMEE